MHVTWANKNPITYCTARKRMQSSPNSIIANNNACPCMRWLLINLDHVRTAMHAYTPCFFCSVIDCIENKGADSLAVWLLQFMRLDPDHQQACEDDDEAAPCVQPACEPTASSHAQCLVAQVVNPLSYPLASLVCTLIAFGPSLHIVHPRPTSTSS